jgi:hypothetical protein
MEGLPPQQDTRFRHCKLTGDQMNFIKHCLINVVHPLKVGDMQGVFGYTDSIMLEFKKADEDLIRTLAESSTMASSCKQEK